MRRLLKAILPVVAMLAVATKAHAVDSFTGSVDSMLTTATSTQTKKGGLNILGRVGVRITTGTAQVNILGNVDIFGNLRADIFTVGQIVNSSATSASLLFVDTIAARSPPLPIKVVSPFLIVGSSFSWVGNASTTSFPPTMTTIEGGTVTANRMFIQPLFASTFTPSWQIDRETHTPVALFSIKRTSSSVGHTSSLDFIAYSTIPHTINGVIPPAFRISNRWEGVDGTSGTISFGYQTGTNYTDVLSISTANRVGIGVSSPAYTFEVKPGTASADWVRASSITLRGVNYNPPPADGALGQGLITNGSGGLSWGNVAGINSTVTLSILAWPGYVYRSTVGFTNLPGAFDTPGHSTWNIVEIGCYCAKNSSVGMTSVQAVVSTNPLTNTAAVLPTFPRVDIPTGASNQNTYSARYSTPNWQVRAGEWIGLQFTTAPISGINPFGVKCAIKGWETQYASP